MRRLDPRTNPTLPGLPTYRMGADRRWFGDYGAENQIDLPLPPPNTEPPKDSRDGES